jgi:hypothetical protein
LDFLLRYPVNLERALEARNGRGDEAKVLDFERLSIESAMVRYRFGPWDFRYRRFVNILISKGLAEVKTKGRMIQLFLTEAGISAAKELASREEFAQIEERTRLLKRHCNLSATNLMKFIYETFPELSSMRAGKPIPQ